VHNGGAIVSHPIVVASFAGGILVPGAGASRYIIPVDADVLVPVLPLLGVHYSQDMHEFVEDASLPVAAGIVCQLVGALQSHFAEAHHSYSSGEASGTAGSGSHADLEMVLAGLAAVLLELEAGLLFNLLHHVVEHSLVVACNAAFKEVRDLSILPFEGIAGVHRPEMASFSRE